MRASNVGLLLQSERKKDEHVFYDIPSTPAAFVWVASCALVESLLFLQSSQIDLIINRYPQQIQVSSISCQHLLGQTCECLAGKHGQGTLTLQLIS